VWPRCHTRGDDHNAPAVIPAPGRTASFAREESRHAVAKPFDRFAVFPLRALWALWALWALRTLGPRRTISAAFNPGAVPVAVRTIPAATIAPTPKLTIVARALLAFRPFRARLPRLSRLAGFPRLTIIAVPIAVPIKPPGTVAPIPIAAMLVRLRRLADLRRRLDFCVDLVAAVLVVV
jgi:hypothetical protein